MDFNGWNYVGDQNLREGGFYWKVDDTDTQSVSVVQIIAYSAAGGPDNLFQLKTGLIMWDLVRGDILESARTHSGLVGGEQFALGDDVAALIGYQGVDNPDEDWTLRIGPVDPYWGGVGEFPEPEHVLRDGTSLRKWIQREYLHREKPEPAATPRM